MVKLWHYLFLPMCMFMMLPTVSVMASDVDRTWRFWKSLEKMTLDSRGSSFMMYSLYQSL